MARAPRAKAHSAAASQVISQALAREGGGARHAVASAVTPIATPPHPGTAVKEAALSMVSRMKRRSSMACTCSGAGRARRERTDPAHRMSVCIPKIKSFVKYFVIQSTWKRDPSRRRRFLTVVPGGLTQGVDALIIIVRILPAEEIVRIPGGSIGHTRTHTAF